MLKSIPNLTVAEFLNKQTDQLGMSDNDLATRLGYDSPSVIAQMKRATIKLPIKDAPAMADALEVDPTWLVKLVLREYSPDTLDVLENVFNKHLLTDSEFTLIEAYRRATGDKDPEVLIFEGKKVVALALA